MARYLLVVCVVLFATPVCAASFVSAEYTGVVTSGQDVEGLFGGGNLAGAAFDMIYSFDPTGWSDVSWANSEQLTSPSGPLAGVQLTINGVSASYIAFQSFEGLTDGSSPPGFTWGYGALRKDGVEFGSNFGSTLKPALTSASFSDACADPDRCTGNFYGAGGEALQFRNDTVTVTLGDPVSGVPEPATWGLFLVGFGLIGVRKRLTLQGEMKRAAT